MTNIPDTLILEVWFKCIQWIKAYEYEADAGGPYIEECQL